MARITNSRDRNKGKSPKPVTTSKGRANRQRVSQAPVSSDTIRSRNSGARITNASQRTNTGSAPVTGNGRPALPPGKRGGDVSPKGAPITRRQNSQPQGTGGPIERVKVRDLGSNKPNRLQSGATPRLTGRSSPNSLPKGNQGGSVQAKATTASTEAAAAKARGLRGRVATAAIAAAGNAILSPLARKAGYQLGKALRPVGRAIDDKTPGINSKDELRRTKEAAAKTGNTSRFAGARDMAAERASRIKGSPVVGPKRQSSAPTPTNANTTQRTATSSSTTAKSTASKADNTPSQAKPAQPGQKFQDFNPNRNTSESNNPMLGDYLRSKMKQREGKDTTTGVGPVKSGDGYESSLRIEKNKKKKDK